MSALAARRETRALVSVWSRRIFLDREYVGRIHPAEGASWVAEFHGRITRKLPDGGAGGPRRARRPELGA